MIRKLAIFLLLAAPALAQTTAPVTGTTALPKGIVTFDGTHFLADGAVIPSATFSVSLTTGAFSVGTPTAVIAGQRYDLVADASGGLTPALEGTAVAAGASASTTTSCAITVPAVAKSAVQVGICTSAGKAVAFKSTAQIVGWSPVMAGAPSTDVTLGHTFGQPAFFGGALYLSVWNYGGQTNPQQVWNVSVTQ